MSGAPIGLKGVYLCLLLKTVTCFTRIAEDHWLAYCVGGCHTQLMPCCVSRSPHEYANGTACPVFLWRSTFSHSLTRSFNLSLSLLIFLSWTHTLNFTDSHSHSYSPIPSPLWSTEPLSLSLPSLIDKLKSLFYCSFKQAVIRQALGIDNSSVTSLPLWPSHEVHRRPAVMTLLS